MRVGVCACARGSPSLATIHSTPLFHWLPQLCVGVAGQSFGLRAGFPIKVPDLFSKDPLGPVPVDKEGSVILEPSYRATFQLHPSWASPGSGGGVQGLGGAWLPTLPTPSMAKRGLRILSLAHWWNWYDLESACLSSNPDRNIYDY